MSTRKELLKLSRLQLIKMCKKQKIPIHERKSEMVTGLLAKSTIKEQPKSKKLKIPRKQRVIYGYAVLLINELIPKEIVLIIVSYCKVDKIAKKYMQILCGDKEHINLGHPWSVQIAMHNIHKTMEFQPDVCLNCYENDCVKFHQSYIQQVNNGQKNVFRNNVNEYKCDRCHYYIAYNVKIFVVYQHRASSGSSSEYIAPFAPTNMDISVVVNKPDQLAYKRCLECKSYKKTIFLVCTSDQWESHRHYGGDSEYIVYCKKCQLFSFRKYHVHEL
eukprot:445662_1